MNYRYDTAYLLSTCLRVYAPIALVLLASVVFSPFSFSEVKQLDKLVEKWLAIERQLVSVQSNWRQQKPILEQRMALLQLEKQQLEKILSNSDGGHNEVTSRRAELLLEQSKMEAEQAQVSADIQVIKQQLEVLAVLLPPTLQSVWQAEQATLTENGKGENSTDEELQVLLAQLSALMDFDSRISVHEAPLTTPEGQQVLVKQLYLGVGAAWFVSGDASYTGFGYANTDGWQWQFSDELDSKKVLAAIAIYERKREVDFVQMPLHNLMKKGRNE